jgi:hypothetical protein
LAAAVVAVAAIVVVAVGATVVAAIVVVGAAVVAVVATGAVVAGTVEIPAAGGGVTSAPQALKATKPTKNRVAKTINRCNDRLAFKFRMLIIPSQVSPLLTFASNGA